MNPFANEFPEHANDILCWIISKMVVSKQAHLSQRRRETDREVGGEEIERKRERDREVRERRERESLFRGRKLLNGY